MNVMVLVKTVKLKVVRPSIFVATPSTFKSFTLKQIDLYNPLLYAYWDLPTEKARNKFGSEAGLRTRQPINGAYHFFHVRGKRCVQLGAAYKCRALNTWTRKGLLITILRSRIIWKVAKTRTRKRKRNEMWNCWKRFKKRKERRARSSKHRVCRIKQAPCGVYSFCAWDVKTERIMSLQV